MKRYRELLPAVIAFCWPLLFLLPYVLNIAGVGNDFNALYYRYKVYLLDFLSHARLPLWSPAEGAGFSFVFNPFAQILYPLNLPLAVFYRLAGGYSALDHIRFTLFGICLFSLGTFLWLRSLRIEARPALFATLVVACSYKITEVLRFPNAVHTMAWFPWILFGVTKAFTCSTKKGTLAAGIILAVSFFCLLTGGYPYYVYYTPFLLLPYIGIMLARRSIGPVPPGETLPVVRPLVTIAAAGMIPCLVCLPYFHKMAALMAQTTDRTGHVIDYSNSGAFTVNDTIGSLLYPPAALTEGWYYFSILALLLVLWYFAGPRSRASDARKPLLWYATARMQLVFILWIALITAITYGKDSPLFVFLWHHVPSFSQLRCWGRMNILLIPIIAWIVALGYARFEGLVFSGTPAARARVFRFLAGAFLLILGIQLFYVTRHFFHPYWADYFLGPKEEALARFVPPAFAPYGRLILAHLHLSFLIASILSFIVLAVMLRRRMSSPNRMLALCVIVACADLGVCGPWTWLARPASSERTVLNIPAVDARSFNTPRTNDYSTISLTSAFSVGIVENWYYARYLRFRGLYATDQRDTRQFLGMDDGKKLYFTRALAHADLRSFLNDAALSSAAMKVLFYDGNTLAIRVAAPRKGYVSFIDNWDPDWKAWIDGCPAEIELLFGAFKAVSVAEGKHTVVLSYRPFSNHNPYPSPS